MRMRYFKPVAAALGFVLVFGTLAIPAYAHESNARRWAANHPYRSWAMHHPNRARHLARIRHRQRNFLRNHPNFRNYTGPAPSAHNNWRNNNRYWAQNGYARYRDDDDQGNGGYYNNGYSPYNSGYYGPGNWSNLANRGYYGPGNWYGHRGDPDGDGD